MATDYDGERFIECQAILAAQAGDTDALAEILDKFLPGELRSLMDAADTLGDATRARLYKRHHMEYPATQKHVRAG
jgi:hypothetical protein